MMPARYVFALSMFAAFAVLPLRAAALAPHTYVASYGADSNASANCAPTTPCRTFNTAIGVTTRGGQVIVLDSAGYGPATITQDVSIIAPNGIYAGVTVSSGIGISISGNGVNYAKIKGLTIENQQVGATGTSGIVVNGAFKVLIVDCVIQGFGDSGILVKGNSLVQPSLTVLRTVLRANGYGIQVLPQTSATSEPSQVTSVDDSSFQENTHAGIQVNDGASLFVSNTAMRNDNISIEFAGNSGLLSGVIDGLEGVARVNVINISGGSMPVSVAVLNSSLSITGSGSSNDAAVYAVGATPGQVSVGLSNCNISKSWIGVSTDANSAFKTLGDNAYSGNGTDRILGAPAIVLLKK